jgi:hypothetical protein
VALHAARPLAVRDLPLRLSKSDWKRYTIQAGSKGPIIADFAFLRVTTVRDELPGERVWLVIRKSVGAAPDLKFLVSNAPPTCALHDLVRLSGWRWPIETVLEEGKSEVGMDHYETRTWAGWHHHMAHTFLAHLFLVRLQLQFKKTPALTIAQARQLVASALNGDPQVLIQASAITAYYQRRNHAAYHSHCKRTRLRHR